MEQLRLLYLENESYHLVDALPYIDTDYGASADISMAVKRLIDEEMKSMPKKDYLEKLPLPPTPYMDESPIFKEASERIATGTKMDVIKGYDFMFFLSPRQNGIFLTSSFLFAFVSNIYFFQHLANHFLKISKLFVGKSQEI